MQPPTEETSLAKEVYGIHANYRATFQDRIDQKLAKLKAPLYVPAIPKSEAEGLHYAEDGLLFLSTVQNDVKTPPSVPRYDLTTPSKDLQSSKRVKCSEDEDESSSSSVVEVQSTLGLPVAVLVEMQKAFQLPEADPSLLDPFPMEEEYEAEVEVTKETGRPSRKTKEVKRYADEDAGPDDDDDSDTKKRKTATKKGKQPLVLLDVQKFNPEKIQSFNILTNPENVRRCALVRKDGQKGTFQLSYNKVADCEFFDVKNSPAGRIWSFFFERAMLTALALYFKCPECIPPKLDLSNENLIVFTEWLADIRVECDMIPKTSPICKLPEDLETPCCSILALVPKYENIQFTTENDVNQHVVLFEPPVYRQYGKVPYSREFVVSSSSLAQILQLHSVLNPLYMMERMMKANFAASKFPKAESKQERRELFRAYKTDLLSNPGSVAGHCAHAFNVWWFYQCNFGVKFAENLIEQREKQKGPKKIATPTLQNRQKLGYYKS
jgi:hypothetical protein